MVDLDVDVHSLHVQIFPNILREFISSYQRHRCTQYTKLKSSYFIIVLASNVHFFIIAATPHAAATLKSYFVMNSRVRHLRELHRVLALSLAQV